MSRRSRTPRPVPAVAVPHASEPLRSPAAAVAVLSAAASRPAGPEVIAVLLDGARRGLAVIVVTGAGPGDEAMVLATLTGARGGPSAGLEVVEAVVLGSVRPDVGVVPDDELRWLELLEQAELAGATLLDWFVLDGRTATSLAAVTGSPDRW